MKDVDGESIFVDLETLLVLNIFNICDTNEISVIIVEEDELTEQYFKVNLKDVKNCELSTKTSIPQIAFYCQWPMLQNGNIVTSGLCSVCRQLIKCSRNANVMNLLGFREACLVACNASSIWTKFCEIDVPMTVKLSLSVEFNYGAIPDNLIRFENHLEQPLRMHNIYKIPRTLHKHTFAENNAVCLSDLLLHPCFVILFKMLKQNTSLIDILPLTSNWLEAVRNLNYGFINFTFPYKLADVPKLISNEHVVKESLYSSDPNRYKPSNRIYTKQGDIEKVMAKVSDLIEIPELGFSYGADLSFTWVNIPMVINPTGGSLPQKRSARKCEQLENLVKAVLKMTASNANVKVIVDFCSGSGHLGLLLGYLLPNCQIILVENKEQSLERAKNTLNSIKIDNVSLLQCNLDYFRAKFDLGIALHACGVATDLVLQNCYTNRANFICCPCCYGGIHNTYHLTYPRSEALDKVRYSEYLHIAHASDQTHGKDNVKTRQGYVCMSIVDLDRKFEAMTRGYVVHLGKLQPETCTPKNNLLVGILNRNV